MYCIYNIQTVYKFYCIQLYQYNIVFIEKV